MSASRLALLGGTPIGSVSSGQHPRFSQDAVDRVIELLKRGATVGLNKNCREIEEAERAIAEWKGEFSTFDFFYTTSCQSGGKSFWISPVLRTFSAFS